MDCFSKFAKNNANVAQNSCCQNRWRGQRKHHNIEPTLTSLCVFFFVSTDSTDPWVKKDKSLDRADNKVTISTSDNDIHSGHIYLNDLMCYLSLLEGGRPEDKLECKYKRLADGAFTLSVTETEIEDIGWLYVIVQRCSYCTKTDNNTDSSLCLGRGHCQSK